MKRRRSYEPGHKPKILIVVDDTPECDRAIYYASRRAARIGAGLVMLKTVDVSDQNQQWLGVADVMRQEAEDEAARALDAASMRASAVATVQTERLVRLGDPVTCIRSLIDEDEDISILVLAAGTDMDGPGPLVSQLGRAAGSFPVPIAVVPGMLTDEELDGLS
jgi:nucleotide-binding universal stress UspA family protein